MLYILEWLSHRDYERRNFQNLSKIQQQMGRLMRYHGLETTEIPNDVHGAPPPTPLRGQAGLMGAAGNEGFATAFQV